MVGRSTLRQQRESDPPWRERWLRGPLVLLCIFFIGLAVAVGEIAKDGWSLGVILSMAVGTALLAVHCWLFYVRLATKSRRPSPHRGGDPSLDELLLRVDEMLKGKARLAGVDVRSEQLELFARALVNSAEQRGRIVEELRPAQRAIRQRVSINLSLERYGSIPSGAGVIEENFAQEPNVKSASRAKRGLCVPILTPSKGELQDDLDITLSNGNSVVTLTYMECVKLVAATLSIVLTKADILSPSDPGLTKLHDCYRDAVNHISRHGPVSDSRIAAGKSCAQNI